ncbi:Histidine kinase-like ATPase domain-containing protein [Micromonospora pattaloongensis]|uniref:Histidine kinase-like ATPase domain-containing protein n=1 Tax=Micromonospora pattaloongensis TaxID=405436 RepID=A0A1H3SG48_9ACTN|nr:ATP-binding SpoIIE family protein phosphatase [Micromonospora pattaloongensis]SDZ36976.1 Histidine kinase-like ATPase domain-containing protein [Micromonospora pattaloongensis]
MAATESLPDGEAWFRVEDVSTVNAVRRATERLAAQIGLGTDRAADLAIVATELASNLVKHAEEGSLLLRPVRDGREAGVEVVAMDSGPGMADLRRSARDGHSTTGTLGIGLGAIARQATWHDAYSVPGRGTVIVAQVWPTSAQPQQPWAAGIARPLTGESVSGDGFATRVVDGRRQVLVCDGLGHGPLAAAAAMTAVNAFRAAPAAPPAAVVEHLHRSLSHTRGAALAVAELDPDAGVLRYAGVGNIAGVVTDGATRRGLVSMPGIAGHHRRTVREFDYPLDPGAVLVMHSDGVTDRWRTTDYPGLLTRAPQLIAATVLRDAGVRRDDACVLVARPPAA